MPLKVARRLLNGAWRVAQDGLKGFFPGKAAPLKGTPPIISPPTVKIFTRGTFRSEDLTDTPLYRGYVELNGGRPLPRFDAELNCCDDLPKDVIAKQLGATFAALDNNAYALMRVKYIDGESHEILVVIDRKYRLARLAEDFIEMRFQLTDFSYESFFLLDTKADRVHLQMVNNLNALLTGKGLMLKTLEQLMHRHFSGYSISTEAVNYKVAKWIAGRFKADFLGSSSKDYQRLVKHLERGGVLNPDIAEEILAAEDPYAAYCLLNGALHRDDNGQTPLEYLLFLIEHMPIPRDDVPELAVQGKIPVS
ncbi:hypothetical protein HZC35_01835 [Candidatus Saganbacteria bacterium]|nr:hypothetical protein [Candidatus Saganbacteria bacterium]